MTAALHELMDRLLSAPAWLVYLIVGLVVFLEDAIFIGFVIPGETVAILGGVAASLGHVSFPVVLLIVIAAAIVGDSVGFEIGKHVGPRILGLRILARHRARLEQAQGFLARRGGAAVFLGRWTAFFRAVMPALAGMSRMRYTKFLLWNAIGGIAWGATVVTVGYVAGKSYARIESWLGRGAAIIVAVLVLAGLVVWHLRRRRQDEEFEAEADVTPARSAETGSATRVDG